MTPLIKQINIKTIEIPFKVVFKHASARRSETESLWVEITSHNGLSGFGESCPREYVTGESLTDAKQFLRDHQESVGKEISKLHSLRAWTEKHRRDIDAHPAAWCAMELALLDLIAKTDRCSVEALLSLPEVSGSFRYSAVISDSGIEQFAEQWKQYRRQGFNDFKLKLSGDLAKDEAKIDVLRNDGDNSFRVRVDANNLWRDVDQAFNHLKALQYPFFAVEEPLTRGRYADLVLLAGELGAAIILDESFLKIEDFNHIEGQPKQWIINLRISKMGGLLRSLAIAEKARESGIRLIIGAQVGETSLLTRAGLTVANTARDIIIAQEGAFGTWLLSEDICSPPLMFKKAGILDASELKLIPNLGFGIDINPGLGFLHA